MTSRQNHLIGSTLALFLAVFATGAASRAGVTKFSAADDFSVAQNPNGVWSYGYSQSLTSSLVLYDDPQNIGGVDFLFSKALNVINTPTVSHNPTDTAINLGPGLWQPNELTFHPGPNGEFSHVRFTAPADDVYSAAGRFAGFDFVGTTTDVHVLVNGAEVFSADVVGTVGTNKPFSVAGVPLKAGDTIDFAVGFGRNQEFSNDTTALTATVIRGAVVPLPVAAATAGPGLALVAALTWLSKWRSRASV
jgi:hypothetical protein